MDRAAWKPLESMAKSERSATKDSLLLAPELALALERQGRVKDASQVVCEAWVASPVLAEWAGGTLTRLAALEPKGVRETVRKTAERRPDRPDIARVAARLEWRAGDSAAAMRLLENADRSAGTTPLRWVFAEERLAAATANDTLGAYEALLSLAGDTARDPAYRLPAARRAWQIAVRRGSEADAASRITRQLQDLPVERWGQDLALPVARALRHAGRTSEARALIGKLGLDTSPEVALERALSELRDAPDDKAVAALEAVAPRSPDAAFHYAEALFFSGRPDSALAWYQRVAADPRGARTGAALERIYLLEDAAPRNALPLVGRLAWERWRGEPKRAITLADSLYRGLEGGPLWSYAALELATLREVTGDGRGALEPLLAVAEKAPDDRLAPLARQRAGDAYRVWYKDDAKAMQQYEECLARYPRAWNAPEVRRMVETMRRERRF
jgi:tetratricopeptide (TPR) repeat protein